MTFWEPSWLGPVLAENFALFQGLDITNSNFYHMEQEADLLDAVLSEDSKQTMTDCFQIAANHFYTNDPSSIHLSTEEKTTLDKGLYIHDCLKRIFNSYSYFCHDLVNFCTAVVNLEASELRNLEQRKESDFAKACHRYFSQPEVMLAASPL